MKNKLKFLCKITKNNLVKNKTNTLFTIASTIICITLIFSLTHYFYTSIYGNYYSSQYASGTWLYQYSSESEDLGKRLKNIAPVEKESVKSTIGTCQYSERYYLEFINYSDFELCPHYLYQGQYPQNDQEILVSRKFISQTKKKIGDKVHLTFQNVDTQKLEDYHLKIVGIIQGDGTSNENYTTTDQVIRLSLKRSSQYHVYVAPMQMTQDQLSKIVFLLSDDLTGSGMNGQIMWNQYIGEPSYVVGGYDFSICIIILLLLCVMFITIKNQFQVSFQKRKHFYGLMYSLGSSGKDLKILTLLESLFYSLIALLVGLPMSYFMTKWIYDYTTQAYLKTSWNTYPNVFLFSPILTGIMMFIVIMMIWICAFLALRKINKESVLDLMKSVYSVPTRKSKRSLLMNTKHAWLSLGLRYPVLDKRKYISIVLTLIFTISFFNISSYFLSVYDQHDKQMNNQDHISVNFTVDFNSNNEYLEDFIDKLNRYNPGNNSLELVSIDMGQLYTIDTQNLSKDYIQYFGYPQTSNVYVSFCGVEDALFESVTHQKEPVFLNKKVKLFDVRNEKEMEIFNKGYVETSFVNHYHIDDDFYREFVNMKILANGTYSFPQFKINNYDDYESLRNEDMLSLNVVAPISYLIDKHNELTHLPDHMMMMSYKMYTDDLNDLAQQIENDQSLTTHILSIINPIAENTKSFSDYMVTILTIFIFIVCVMNLGVVLMSNVFERQQDYALYQSLGMDQHQLKKMIYTENILLVISAILISLPIVVLGEGYIYYYIFVTLQRFIPSYTIFFMMCLVLIVMCIIVSEIIYRKCHRISIIDMMKKDQVY